MNLINRLFLTSALLLISSPTHAADKVYTLQDAYQSALGANETVKISEESLLQAGDRIDQAWTYIYPRLDGRSSYTRYNEVLPPGGGDFIFQPLNQFQAALVLRQPVYTGGRTFAALRTAETLREAGVNNLVAVKENIMINVAQAYYRVIKNQKMADVSRHSMERMERHKKVTEREAATRKTKANSSALLRAKTMVSQARINLLRVEDAIKIAREHFSLLTKLPVDAAIAEPEGIKPSAETIIQLKQAALANRADYQILRLNRKIAEENVTIVRGGHYPQVYAEGVVQYQDSNPRTAFDGTIYYGGLRLQIPLFEGGLMRAETSEAKSKVRQAELSVSQVQASIETEVYDAYINLQTLNEVLEIAKLQMSYARDNFEAVEGLYREGLVTSVSMIDAEQALSQAEQEVVNSTYDQQLAILRIRKSIGTLGKEAGN